MSKPQNRNERNLTPREDAVVELLLVGKSTQEIASELAIKPATVRMYLKHMYDRLGVRSKVQLIARVSGRA